jgi:FAD/FMN-containing dehydrogenase/Fe-S oxidoreductase
MPALNPDFIAELRKDFRGEIRTDLATRILYSTDASIYQIQPLGVALPKTQDDLQAAVELAVRHRIPILPRGAGLSLAGQAIGEALILDCSRWLNDLIDIDHESRTATVEPGLVLSRLNAAAAKHGLTFGPDPASAERATLGGVIGNNATGAHSILYGMTADHLVSADVIQGDGSLATWEAVETSSIGDHWSAIASTAMEIREKYAGAIQKNYPQSWRNSAGYRLNYLLPWSPSAPPQWSDDWSQDTGCYPPVIPNMINLAPLLAGSEGTLAVIRRATVSLVPKPKHTILVVLAYDSNADACEDVPRLLEFKPSAVELVPRMLIQLARGVPAYASQLGWVKGDPAALLVVEFSGDRPEVLKEAALRLRSEKMAEKFVLAETEEAQTNVWSVRKVGLGIFDSRPADARPVAFIEDCAIPVENLGEFVHEIETILAAHNTYAAFYAHASAGCLHIRAVLDLKRGEGVRSLRSISEATLALTLRLGGSMSSEHGDGIARAEYLQRIYGPEVVAAMRKLKQAADPYNLLNPGKMLAAPPMDTHLRYGADYKAEAWEPALDFSRNNRLAGGIEQCNGQGVCRKDSGTMCPSFQASSEEAYSTRGRANLLRAMVSSPMSLRATTRSKTLLSKERLLRRHYMAPRNDMLETAVFGALDLCLACKGCKAECPSGVDMAKLKYEFQHEYYKSHRRKLRDYLFAYIGTLAKMAAPIGKLVNCGLNFIQGFANPLLGLAENRALPRFNVIASEAKPSPRIWHYLFPGRLHPRRVSIRASQSILSPTRPATPHTDDLEKVLLLRDTFTHFFEPEIEGAVTEVLNACGVEVLNLPYFGAGRTLISKGFIEPARQHAERVLDSVQRLDPQGEMPVLGIEPSELYTLRDEFIDLLPHQRAEVEKLTARSWLVEEFLLRPDKNHNLRVTNILQRSKSNHKQFAIKSPRVHLHGHCYQKSQPPAADGFPVGQSASAKLLRVAGYSVEIIPSGCCGMAGAFGYEAEHYDLSMQVGELVLFPYIRKTGIGNRELVATGTSCRAQIADGTGVTALHPLVLVADRLRELENAF